MVEAVGHADGDLDPVVERLEPRVRIARPDRPEDVGTPASDLPGRFDDFGDVAAGRPEHPMLQFAPGSSDRASEQTAQEFLELPGSAHGTDAPGAVDARHHGDQPHPPAAEIPVPPTAHAAAPAITTSFPPAARAARRRLPGAHMDLEHGPGRSGPSTILADSTTMPLTLRRRLNMPFIRRFPWFVSLVGKQNTRKRPLRLRNQRLNDEPTPTKTAIAPQNKRPQFPLDEWHCPIRSLGAAKRCDESRRYSQAIH